MISAKPCRSSLTGRMETPILLILVVLTALAGMAALLIFSINTINKLTQQHLHSQVEVAIDVEHARLNDLVVEYSYWDEAYQKLVLKRDLEWADENIGAYLNDSYSIDLALVISADERIIIAFENGKSAPDIESTALLQALQSLLHASRQTYTEPNPQKGFIVYRGDAYMFSLDSFTPEYAHSHKTDGSVLALGRKLDEHYISQINNTYRLPGLHLSDLGHTRDSRLLLRSAHNRVVAALGWPKAAPATQSFKVVFAPLLALVALMIGLGAWILRRENIKRCQYEKHLQNLARTDPLTGILNRRAFYQMVTREMGRVHRDHSDLTMLVLDLDHFKAINDQFGHETGDSVLQAFTQLIRDNLREADIFSRIGGEEFALALPGTNEQQALEMAERLRRKVAALKIFHDLKKMQITVSIGISQYQPGDTHESLITRADRAMYHSKDNGRNQSSILAR